jgi:hypothetical protein
MPTYYCTNADVGMRLGLDSGQRTRASSRIEACIRRASIKIDQCFLDYGRDEPSGALVETTLNAALDLATDSTQFRVSSFTGFPSSGGSGNISGDTFKYTGLNNAGGQYYVTGVTGLSFDHASGETVQVGELAHVVREICADIATGLYLEDEATMQNSKDLRGTNMRERGMIELQRLAHMGKA